MQSLVLADHSFLAIVHGANREVYPVGQHDRAY